MITEAINRILALAPPYREAINGLDYSDRQLQLIQPPQPAAVEIDTLDGFVELMERNLNEFDPVKVFVWVQTFESVALSSLDVDKYAHRMKHISVKPTKGLTGFTFNQWTNQEAFIIGLQAGFQPSPDLDYLLKLTSHVDGKTAVKTIDNSVTQEVTVQNGVAFKEEVEVKARLSLKPYRTFRELDQTASDFIFRVKDNANFALYEADGGAWKIAAMKQVANYLSNRLKGSTVATLNDIPVIC